MSPDDDDDDDDDDDHDTPVCPTWALGPLESARHRNIQSWTPVSKV